MISRRRLWVSRIAAVRSFFWGFSGNHSECILTEYVCDVWGLTVGAELPAMPFIVRRKLQPALSLDACPAPPAVLAAAAAAAPAAAASVAAAGGDGGTSAAIAVAASAPAGGLSKPQSSPLALNQPAASMLDGGAGGGARSDPFPAPVAAPKPAGLGKKPGGLGLKYARVLAVSILLSCCWVVDFGARADSIWRMPRWIRRMLRG